MTYTYFWFRRDLRLNDNAGLYYALKSGLPVKCVFIFDENILENLPNDDPRVGFIHKSLEHIEEKLKIHGSAISIYKGKPDQIWQEILSKNDAHEIFTNEDYEPYAIYRDQKIRQIASAYNINFKLFKDHVIFHKDEVLKDDGKPYTVFTPYKKKWFAKLSHGIQKDSLFYAHSYPSEKYLNGCFKTINNKFPSLKELGFDYSPIVVPDLEIKTNLIKTYDTTRDYPSIAGTSRLGIHFRFGTISIREKLKKALDLNEVFVSELIWREFYSMILYHFPQVVTQAFRPEYDRIVWLNDPVDFEKWKAGLTGYPLVDAGMRELNATGYMHNRVRMVTASFLTKHLLIDWRWGESYFAQKLLDFDLASNNGGWQWAAGCGTDAAPYFRIFNPIEQQKKFDKDLVYIKKWIPEYGTMLYPEPIIEHKYARERCLATYKAALKD